MTSNENNTLLNSLRRKRETVKNQIKRAEEVVSKFKTGDNINLLKSRREILRDTFKEFNKIQSDIEEHVPLDQLDVELGEARMVETTYHEIAALIDTLIEENNIFNKVTQATVAQKTALKINLPSISLPDFNGSLEKWLHFRDTYKSLVHDNSNLTDIEKMHYLKSTLSGEALRTIESLSISAANYESAWDLLQQRFENIRLIVQAHIKKITNAPVITKGNASNLRQLVDETRTNISALKVLGEPVSEWNSILVTIIADKLDFYTTRDWHATITSNKQVPPLNSLLNFLESRCQNSEAISLLHNNKPNASSYPKSRPYVKTEFKSQSVSNVSTKKQTICEFCKKQNHVISQCRIFLRLNTKQRLNEVEKLKLCTNCLRSNHEISECKSVSLCNECKGKHSSLLHDEMVVTSDSHNLITPSTSYANHSQNGRNYNLECLLSTATVLAKDSQGNFQPSRALIDSGSQSHFITNDLCRKLKLTTNKIMHQINGINNAQSNVTEIAEVCIKSCSEQYSSKISCLVLEKITNNLPLHSFTGSALNIPENIVLADKDYNRSGPIDLLLGADIFLELLKNGKIQLGKRVYLQNTCLGFIIGGSMNLQSNRSIDNYYSTSCHLSLKNDQLEVLNQQVQAFWRVEDLPNVPNSPTTNEEKACELHFVNNFCRDVDGRFIVTLPTKGDTIQLGTSANMAKHRFLNLERKLGNNVELSNQYKQFMREYQLLGHMQLVPTEDLDKSDAYYLPHHAVFKNKKIRVVFDASAKSSNSKSLNDNLLIGPKLQQEIFTILMRFRTYQYVLSADIEKMYRQIKISKDDLDYHRVFWRDSPKEPLKQYRLTTLTYGTACAPFLAIRCLKQLAVENVKIYPQASAVLKKDFYMDDLLTGADCIREITIIREQLTQILKSGGFNLTKWASNVQGCLPSNTHSIEQHSDISLDKNDVTKTLGLFWNCSNDILKYKVNSEPIPAVVTKRNILAAVCRIFDPLGLINPVIVKAKILLQQLWRQKLDWDEPVPDDIKKSWTQFMNEIKSLDEIEIPRKVLLFKAKIIELHGFADASEKAYGAAIYLKSVSEDNQVSVRLLVAKSRVAPLKSLSIPRLELLAAQLLAQLAVKVVNTVALTITNKFFYTDSQIVLAWIGKEPGTWQTFVANRVSNIQTLTNIKDWNHVSGLENPADVISRGMMPATIVNHEMWWHGPTWLQHPLGSNPETIGSDRELKEIPEKRAAVISNVAVNNLNCDEFTKYSNFTKLKRVIALVKRFAHNCKHSENKRNGPITTKELNLANITIIKAVQQQTFSAEINDLLNNQNPKKGSPLYNLNPFIDQDGILRVGGRLSHATITYDQKFPAILPKNNCVTDIIINWFHLKNLHAPAHATLAAMRQQFWPLAGRSKVRQLLHQCIKCFRVRPITSQQQMGNLPVKRVEPARPFINTGIDYCGPVLLKDSRGRGKRSYKAYICVFVCLCTKAIHLELVGDLTTDSFLNALRRFISRRGFVKYITSDNATNFQGACNELLQLRKFLEGKKFDEIVIKLTNDEIKWEFIPPRSPNFGGLWESAVKSVKHHLYRVIGETVLTYEEMYTLLTRIEACVNSRPIIPLSSDPNDFNALTPSHFLIGEVLTAPLEQDLTELKVNRLNRWQLIEQLRQHFWKRWQVEYLAELQRRNKWCVPKPSIKVGAMVLMVEENIPPLHWPLGRIHQVHPGKDGVVRVVTVKTAKGCYKRGITKICELPMDSV